ncbi:LytR/AlgR family response regulator transcription factor [Phenylobacterium aquaticum]|uniref:LytR/AlgR family response regulator transcription factor n=1 Tax=Phenylobacterium aquaticum TaxID=1763816 RepID=UPI001F5E0108|nr:LytTR family DNA-binding domain-containing protein [Phenylobacterium aquaticum]MCI3133877.1 LytTR family transcriptional regulator [Phenylobacterium aquaticum]
MTPPSPATSARNLSVVRLTGVGFLYWLAFMSVLEPGNLAHALAAGFHPHWSHEALRLLVAGLLGASVTPVLVLLARRFPISGARRLAPIAGQAIGALALAPVLIVASCCLAAWILQHRWLPAPADIGREMAANLLLVMFCQALFLAALQVLIPAGRAQTTDGWPERLTLRNGAEIAVIDLAEVEWIEAQGNYQALHVRGRTHLTRETSARLQERLDPSRFVRIHRGTMVSVAHVAQIEPLTNGDGLVTLHSGTVLRLSRNHRQALRDRLGGDANR